ncbi:MAG: hypothetical protein A3G18_05710 [Rhodospirillales bacterium RIFCSPLOWO2_12_FULL_58_28]|nr:MAG: hypothetical protein A3H92_00015 [Rhodospirillales bacterium RIFCSPLOWO2_02_FULL_58_16]OHC79281.1 MAG: hypothetical protein A3G18_05710 [Rhodospirillales bacterium RIFCSPLOWO2_12_FULL_58_28]
MSDPINLAPVAGGVPVWREDGVVHIDVRGMEPPRPFVAIIELIERPGSGDIVAVRLHRDPVFLYPELTERGWSWERLPACEGEVRLRLVKDRPGL